MWPLGQGALRGIPHGEAVGQGLLFALEWSSKRFRISRAERSFCRRLVEERLGLVPYSRTVPAEWRPLSARSLAGVLAKDKKRAGEDSIRFIFLRGPGRPVPVEVSIRSVVGESIAQGFAR